MAGDGICAPLDALDYPRKKHFRLEDQDELCKLIKWVEDRIIRFYDVDERDALRGAGPQWRPAFEKYLVDLGCPYKWSDAAVDQRRALRWVLSKAVACAYEDDSDRLNSINSKPSSPDSNGPPEELRERIIALAAKLGVAHEGSDTTTILESIRSVVSVKLTPSAIEAAREAKEQRLKIDDFELAYSTKDKVVDRVARALTMLYVTDLRDLQNDINDILVSAQEFTANPKTNTALGQVGR